jgi:hypothetical protein
VVVFLFLLVVIGGKSEAQGIGRLKVPAKGFFGPIEERSNYNSVPLIAQKIAVRFPSSKCTTGTTVLVFAVSFAGDIMQSVSRARKMCLHERSKTSVPAILI